MRHPAKINKFFPIPPTIGAKVTEHEYQHETDEKHANHKLQQ